MTKNTNTFIEMTIWFFYVYLYELIIYLKSNETYQIACLDNEGIMNHFELDKYVLIDINKNEIKQIYITNNIYEAGHSAP